MYDQSRAPLFRGILYANREQDAQQLAHRIYALGYTPDECLLLAATDAEIRAANELNMAVAAYVDPDFPNQTYEGAGIIIEGFDEVDEKFLRRVFERHHNIPWVVARTQRCVIRELTLDDIGELTELYDRPGITCRMGPAGEYLPGYIEPLYPMEEEMEYQRCYIQNMYRFYGYGMWLVFDRASNTLIGRAGIENREYPEGVEQELGYLIHPDWQRRGIATEVCTAILTYAKKELGLDRISLLTDGENVPSVRLAEKLGFRYAGDTDVSGSRTRKYVFIFAKNQPQQH